MTESEVKIGEQSGHCVVNPLADVFCRPYSTKKLVYSLIPSYPEIIKRVKIFYRLIVTTNVLFAIRKTSACYIANNSS